MCIMFRKSACQTKMYLPESPFFKKSLAGASGLVLMSVPVYNNWKAQIIEIVGTESCIGLGGCLPWVPPFSPLVINWPREKDENDLCS